MRRFVSGIGYCLFLGFTVTAVAKSAIFSRIATEANQTYTEVVWYLENGYLREDLKYYLSPAPAF